MRIGLFALSKKFLSDKSVSQVLFCLLKSAEEGEGEEGDEEMTTRGK